jgi:hypothetical protein
MSETRLRALEMELCSIRETGELLGRHQNQIWLWRRGALT